jgi:mitogen-activated protein kinase 1/3
MKRLEINGINFDLPDRYEPIKLIGKGTYGAVISAVDNSTKEKGRSWHRWFGYLLRVFIVSYHLVAIKKLGKIDDMIDAKRVLREIKIMKSLQHENILGLKDVLYHPKEG